MSSPLGVRPLREADLNKDHFVSGHLRNQGALFVETA
jgi:hypothetical protein